MSYSNPNLEYRLLCAFRSEQNHQQLFNTPNELFTDQREALFAAYKQALQTYGNLSIDSIEAVYGKSAPDEVYVPIDIDVDPLIDNLRKLQRKRELKLLAEVTERISKEHDPDITPILDLVQKQAQISNPIDTSVQSGVSLFLTEFGNKVRGDYKFLSTGIRFLDTMMGGEWCRSEVTLISGKTGGGKSALMGSSAIAMAQNGDPVLIFSHEMKKSELVSRWISHITGIDNRYIRSGKVSLTKSLSAEQIASIEEASQLLNKLPIYVVDTTALSIQDMLNTIAYHYTNFGVNMVFIDYLQRMPYDFSQGMHRGLSDNTIRLTDIAKKYNIAIAILAQVHEDLRIRDTGDADKHAAVWVHISIDADDNGNGIRSATLNFLKNRHGALGSHPVLYNGKLLKFYGNNEEAYT